MANANERRVVREGKDWMELQKVDPWGRLWRVTDGTVAVAGDIVRFDRLNRFEGAGEADLEAPLSPFEAEIVVDTVTKAVLLPESGEPSTPVRQTLRLFGILKAAGLQDQAQIVWEWLGLLEDGDQSGRHAA